MRKCSKCNIEKPKSEFGKGNSKEGLQYKCKDCKKVYYQNNKEKISKRNKEKHLLEPPKLILPKGIKRCCECNIEKLLSEFYKDKSTKDGLKNNCKECSNKRGKQYKIDNLEKVLKSKRLFATKKRQSEGYGVYIITHIPTQCYYIGEGWINSRRITHFSELKREENKSGGLQRFFDKHPNIEDYKFEVIKKWDDHNKVEGKKLEDKLIIEGLNNNSAKILNIRVK